MAARYAGVKKSFEVGLPDAMETALPNGAHVPVDIPATPPGLAALFRGCRNIYPDQPNPLQVTALVKYWLGGPDPLDYISMYSNPGDPVTDCAPHWHYISFGLSDLHGDGRVHARNVGADASEQASGFGFELSFRLKRAEIEDSPPTWPASIMQALARYIFKFRNLFCVGDHISWHCPIDGSSGTKLHHFLLAEDPQLGIVQTPYGTVQFLQLVGITQDELESVQHWNGPEILTIMRRVIGCGGDWLVTDLRRRSIFETDPSTRDDVDAGVVRDGSNLSGVSAQCCWCEMDLPTLSRCSVAASNSVTMASVGEGDTGGAAHGIDALTGSMSSMAISQDVSGGATAAGNNNGMRSISLHESEQIKNILRKGLASNSVDAAARRKGASAGSSDLVRRSTGQSVSAYLGGNLESTAKSLEFIHSTYLEGVHLCFNIEAGSLLPLAIRGRVMHGRHFTFQGMTVENDESTVVGGNVITFVSEKVKGSWASVSHPYAARGTWLHVLLPPAFAHKMYADVHAVVSASKEQRILPRTLEWPEEKITITLMPDQR